MNLERAELIAFIGLLHHYEESGRPFPKLYQDCIDGWMVAANAFITSRELDVTAKLRARQAAVEFLTKCEDDHWTSVLARKDVGR